MSSLSIAFRQFRQNSLSWSDFFAIACSHVDRILVKKFRFTTDTRMEVIADFYPKFTRICRDYTECGASFEAYLYTSLYFFCKSWCRRQSDRWDREFLVSDDYDDFFTMSEDPVERIDEYRDDAAAILANSRRRDTVRRQLLICLCKNIPMLSHDEALRYAAAYDIPPSMVYHVEAYAHRKRERASRDRAYYQELRDRHYAAMLRYETEGRRSSTQHTRETADRMYAFHRRRWEHYRHRLAHQALHLSNREVGMLLGIPKGSIDSAIAGLARRLASLVRRR